ncbi:integrase catalytic domain-containing protein [Trichonephila clavata]|uniref:Integrase catalytic domain-containing protein n=1 Tax=Trichonephila clavata TaxID=2740835 RepID=A0A8X6LPG9_TRICU|nr:integrase catalytic domain-containing protein [Trichonephila clavata]
MFLQDTREVGVPELDRIDENKLNKRLVYRNRIQTDLRKRFRVEYLGQLRKIKNIKGEDTLSEGDIVLVGDDHTKRINWNLDTELSKHQGAATPLTQTCSSVSNGGARLEPRAETSSHQQAETSSMQPCSSVSNGGGGLKLRAETSGHQRAETSSMQPCSSISDVEAGVEPRVETLELPDDLTSELQQPAPRRSRYGRLLKLRKRLNDSC